MKLLKTLSFVALATLICGCTVSKEECDPRGDPGFFNKLGCTVSGSYSQRVEDKKAHVAKLREELHVFSQETAALNDEDALINEDRASAQRRLDRINTELLKLEQKVAVKAGQHSALMKQVASAKDQLKTVQTLPQNASIIEKQVQKQKLEAELDELLQAQTAALEP